MCKKHSGLGISIHPHLASYPLLGLSPLLLQTSPLQCPALYTQEGTTKGGCCSCLDPTPTLVPEATVADAPYGQYEAYPSSSPTQEVLVRTMNHQSWKVRTDIGSRPFLTSLGQLKLRKGMCVCVCVCVCVDSGDRTNAGWNPSKLVAEIESQSLDLQLVFRGFFVLFCFDFSAMPQGMWDLSSPTRA